ncbi:MAG: phage tail protein [Streptomyces sp.]|nr:phage tail protein [Streptomyces sp.]NUP36207.1 phage tail protein [Streptomyces sp.]NUS75554.1 phage tail protein [Streptomyces sp.]
MTGDAVTIRVTATTQQAQRAFKDLKSEVGGLKGTLIPLATAAAPLTAALAPVAVKAAGAGTAVAAFGAAVAGQVSHLSDAADAQDKYTDAVSKYGRGSKQAAEAQRALSATLSSMPQATARASVAVSTLKDDFRAWSDELAGFTMTPVEKSITLVTQLLPKLTPMAKGASAQLDRLVTVAGGAMATPGFDALADKVSTFANESLRDAVNSAIHFTRALSEGRAGGPIQAFMEYAHKNGPALRETLHNIGDAVTTLVQASADAGPGMLSLVNAGLKLVAAMPPELVTTLMQAAVALKALKLAGAGVAMVAGGVEMLAARIVALRAASAAAGGGMAGLSAAFGTLSRAAKATLIASGIGAIVLAMSELSQMGKAAPPDVDKLSTSLRTLGESGKVSGEAARVLGKDLSGFADSLQKVVDPKGLDKVQQSIVSFFGTDSTPIKDAKEKIDAVDKALADLVKGGHADLAAAALATLSKRMKDQGFSSKEISGQMDDYKSALADAAFEQQLAIQSMGIFGTAAQDTSAKLDAQKNAADGLRASILALNDANRSAYDAQIQYEAAVDDLTSAFKKNGATLDIHTEKGRANGEAMSAAAKAQDEFIAAGVAAGDSLSSMTKKSDELRGTMMKLATDAFDGNKKKARDYVNTLLGVPSEIKTLVKAEKDQAVSGLKDVQAEIQKTPNAHKVTVSTLNGAAIKALNAVGLKTKQLPDGRTAVYTKNGSALASIDALRRALNSINGKKAVTFTFHKVETQYSYSGHPPSSGKSLHSMLAGGGRVPRYADGGDVQFAPNGLISGPGTGTSDDVLALFASGAMGRVSDTEFVVNAASTRKYLPLLEAINDDKLKIGSFAKGGKLTKAQKAAAAQKKAEHEAVADARSDLTISHFGQMAGYKRSEFRSALAKPDSLGSLVDSLNHWASIIKKATHGGVEKSLLKSLDSAGKKLLSWEKQLGGVTKSLEKARDKLDSLKSAAAQLADSVKGGILSGANITRAAGAEDSRVTINTILSQMQGSASNSKEFDKALKELKKRGLSPALLQQIAEAGIEGGGLETAQALLGASSGQLKSLNSLQGQINTAATSAGKTTADAVYKDAIAHQTTVVKHLTDQQKKLATAMDNLASSMEKLVEKAFKGKAAGGIVGAAASGGVRSGLTWVGEHEPELLDLPSGARVWSGPDSRRMQHAAWASMLNEPRRGPSRVPVAAGGGNGGGLWVIQLQLGTTQLGEVIIDPLRKAVKTRGGLKATFGGLD